MKKIVYLPNIFKPFNVGNLVRLGGNKDGGYLLSKKSLSKSNFLITLGVAYNWDFELDFLKKKQSVNLSIIACDNSISREIVKKFSLKSLFLFFIRPSFKKIQHICKFFSYINTFDGKKAIHFPLNVTRSNTYRTINLKKLFSFIKKKSVILKIDIEGGEYYLLDDIFKYLNQINVLIIEFHSIQKNKKNFFNFIKRISNKFYISHVHINNVSLSNNGKKAEIIEFTFEKKLLFNKKVVHSKQSYPLKNLDYPSSKKVDDCRILFQ